MSRFKTIDDELRERREKQKHNGWIGVDLDGTLFTYTKWVGWNVFGDPIAPMIQRVQRWIADGFAVKVFTARLGDPRAARLGDPRVPPLDKVETRYVTKERFSRAMMINAVQDHCVVHALPRLPVTNVKTHDMIELWDDRAVQVVTNTGRTLHDEHEAELAALRGAP